MNAIEVQLWRWDRDPDDHHYGGPIDALLDELAGGAQALDRTVGLPRYPAALLKGTEIRLELHEDGPLFQVVIEQIPAYITAIAALLVAWRTWKPKDRSQRSVRVRVGQHSYEGEPSPQELGRILDVFKGLNSKAEQARTDPRPS